jgi:hypothetical protein
MKAHKQTFLICLLALAGQAAFASGVHIKLTAATTSGYSFSAGSNIFIPGTVVDDQGNPIPGVQVLAEDPILRQSRYVGQPTNSKGEFVLSYSSSATQQPGYYVVQLATGLSTYTPVGILITPQNLITNSIPAFQFPVGQFDSVANSTAATRALGIQNGSTPEYIMPSNADRFSTTQSAGSAMFKWMLQGGLDYVKDPRNDVMVVTAAVTCSLGGPADPLCPIALGYVVNGIAQKVVVANLKLLVQKKTDLSVNERNSINFLIDEGSLAYSILSFNPDGSIDAAVSSLDLLTDVSTVSVSSDSSGNVFANAVTSSGKGICIVGVQNSSSTNPVPVAPNQLQAASVSTSQINVSWSGVSGVTSYKLERSTRGGAYSVIATLGPSVTAFSDNGLAVGSDYYYQVRAYNSSGYSPYSSVATATTFAAASAGGNSTLTVQALDIENSQYVALGVSSWVGTSLNYLTNTTTFTRSVAKGSSLSVLCPNSLPNGKVFVYWMLDNSTLIYNTVTSVNMNGNHSLIAVYVTASGSPRTFTRLAINGPSSVSENTSQQYTTTAYFSDGSSAQVTPVVWAVVPSGQASISNSGVLDAGAASSNTSVSVSTSYLLNGVLQTASIPITITHTNTNQTYTLSVATSGDGSVTRIPNQTQFAAGTQVTLRAVANSGSRFSQWSGSVTGGSTDLTFTMDGNKSITAIFTQNVEQTGIRVTILPAEAANAGAGWKCSSSRMWLTDWQPSGGSSGYIDPGSYRVTFNQIPGWITPADQQVDVILTQTKQVTATYTPAPGALQVSLNPPAAITAGGNWRLDGGIWLSSGASLLNLAPGNHTLDFKSDIPGWTAPAAKIIQITSDKTRVEVAEYSPPAGVPFINSIGPSSGPISGGTIVTIKGANFTSQSTVTFDGKAAQSVNFVDSSTLTATTPSRTNYGTASVVVSSIGGQATSNNGFTYSIPRGSNFQLVGQIGGDVRGVTLSGNYAYIGEGAGLVVLDITNPAQPAKIGSIPLPGIVSQIVVSGNYAYVANSDGGLQVVDISTKTAPRIVGIFTTKNAVSVSISATTVYLVDGTDGVYTLDCSTPSTPKLLGTLTVGGTANSGVLGTNGSATILYVGVQDYGLRLVDVTNPSNMFLRGGVSSIAATRQLAINGTRVYIANDAASGGICVVDASNPDAPRILGSNGMFAYGLSIQGSNCYYASNGELVKIDASNPSSPQVMGGFGSSALSITSEYYASTSSTVAVAGSFAYVADCNQGLKIFDITKLNTASLVGRYSGLGEVWGVSTSSNSAYLACDTNGLQILDTSNPSAMRLAGSLLFPNTQMWEVQYYNGKVIMGSSIVDVSVLNNPSLVGKYTQSYVNTSLAYNDLLYCAAADLSRTPYTPILDIVSMSNPTNPTRIGICQLNVAAQGTCRRVFVSGTLAFVADYDRGMEIVDVSNPSAPKLLGSVDTPGTASAVALTEDSHYAIVADSQEGIQIIDVSTPTIPQIVKNFRPGYAITNVTVSGATVFASGTWGVYALDIHNPLQPVKVGEYDMPGRTEGISLNNGLIYVADSSGGLAILKYDNASAPIIGIQNPVTGPTYSTSVANVNLSGTSSSGTGNISITWANNRGGGGAASGSSSWSVNSISLFSGENVITVTATDSTGKVGTAILTVTYTPLDLTAPLVIITGPCSDGQFTVNSPSVTLAGAAADNIGVTEITWSNDRGGSGSLQLTQGTWSVPNLALQQGPNKITVTAKDATGNSGSDTSTIFYTLPDTTPPTVTIDFPTVDATYETSSSTINLSGQSSDDQGVAKVEWVNNRGGAGTATGFTPWSANGIALQSGLNIIDITATDTSGNVSTDTLSVTYTPPPIPTPTKAVMTAPIPGSTLTGNAQAFTWNAGTLATEYWLSVGSTLGGNDYFYDSTGLALNQAVTGLPTKGSTIYVRLWTNFASGWVYTDYTYTAANISTLGALTVTLSPAGAVSAGAQWQVDSNGTWQNSGATVTSLAAGSHTVAFRAANGYTTPASQTATVIANQTINASGTYVAVPTGSLSVTLSPAGALTAGAQWQVDGGAWQSSGATLSSLTTGSHTVAFKAASAYTTPANQTVTVVANQTITANGTYAVVAPPAAVMVSPVPSSTLTGNSQTFAWNAGSQAWEYWLSVGSTLGGTNYFYASTGTALKQAVTGLPTNGSPIYVRLWSSLASGWVYTDYTYTAATISTVGALTVTLSPAGAVSAGAQWQLDGGTWQNSGVTVSSLSAGNHTVTFKAASGYTAPASQTVTVVANQTITANGTYVVAAPGSLSVALSPAGAVTAGAQWQVDGNGTWQSSGATVSNLAAGNHTVAFKAASGYTTPAGQTVAVLSNQTISANGSYAVALLPTAVMATPVPGSTLSGSSQTFTWNAGTQAWEYWLSVGSTLGGTNYFYASTGTALKQAVTGLPTNGSPIYVRLWSSLDSGWVYTDYTYTAAGTSTLGALTVALSPAGAVSAGAQWQADTSGVWQNSGATVSSLSAGNHTVTFKAASGYTAPASQTVTIVANQTITANGTYVVAAPGSLSVALSPAGAVTAGAQWQVDGGAWQNTGATVSSLSAGNHTVTFKAASGYTTPASQTVIVLSNQTINTSGTYAVAPLPTAVMATPVPGSTLTGNAQTFTWNAGTQAWEYWLSVGSTPGGTNFFCASTGTALKQAVTGLPTNGSPIYVRLWSSLASGWVYTDYTYTAAGTSSLGALTVALSPAGAVSAGAQWQADSSGIWQTSGATVSSLAAGNHTVTFKAASGYTAPASQTVTVIANQSITANGTYVVAAPGSLSVALSPAGALTAGAQWQVDGNGTWQNSGATVSNLAAGNHSVTFKAATGYTTPASQAVAVLSNQTITANATYSAAPLPTAVMATPVPGSTLTGNAQTFTWNAGTQAWEYWLSVGSTPGGSNYFYASTGSALRQTVTGLPTNGSPIYVRLWSSLDSGWVYTDYTYTAAGTSSLGALTVALSPAGAVSAGAQWQLDSGSWQTSGATISSLSAGNHTLAFKAVNGYTAPTSQTVTVIANQTITPNCTYVAAAPGSLSVALSPAGAVSAGAQWQVDGGAWQTSGATVSSLSAGNHTVTFKAASGYTVPPSQTVTVVSNQTLSASGTYVAGVSPIAVMSLPAPGSTLTGGSAQTFTWNGGSEAMEYWLYVGSKLGGADFFNGSTGAGLKQTTYTPTNGSTIYVRLWTSVASGWVYNDYTYTAPTVSTVGGATISTGLGGSGQGGGSITTVSGNTTLTGNGTLGTSQ